uniref:Putative dual specificity n=1 Tax=Rhipicephalus pulchellus TaxID=72859 RepID=L7LZI3_RHIPC
MTTPYRSKIAGRSSNTSAKTPEPPSPVRPASRSRNLLKTRSSPEESTGGISGFRGVLCSSGAMSTPYRSKIAGHLSNSCPKTPEPPSPVRPLSLSSSKLLMRSVEKSSASSSELKASLPAVAQQSPVSQQSTQRSTASVLGKCSDTDCSQTHVPCSTPAPGSNTQGSRGIAPCSSYKPFETPPIVRKCREHPSLFNIRLEISDDDDESEEETPKPGWDESEEEKPKPDIAPMKRSSGCPKPFPSPSASNKRYPSSSAPPRSSVHKLSPAKGRLSGMLKNEACSSQPQQLQQQYSSKRGHMPSKASHGARAERAALDSLLPCKAASMKSDPGSYKGAGLPVEDGVSGRRNCRAALEEKNGVLQSHPLEAQQVLEVSQHSKKKSLQSVMFDFNPPTEDFYVEIDGKKYHMLRLIARGGSSKVFTMFNDRKELRAVKLVSLAGLSEAVIKAFVQEVSILTSLRSCDRVVRLFHSQLSIKEKVLALVMEKGDQDLATVLMNRSGNLDPVTIKFYWSEMLQAVKEIHEKRVVHSDLKPANFILVAGKLKLIDFGIADQIQEDVTSVLRGSPMGTVNFMSPESIQYTSQKQGINYIKVGLKSDVWSLGCILYCLVYGKTPFHDICATHDKLLAIVDKRKAIDFPDVSEPHLLDVLKKCLRRDPETRPSVSELLQHPYLVETAAVKEPHIQALISDIENLSPSSALKVKKMVKSMREGKP